MKKLKLYQMYLDEERISAREREKYLSARKALTRLAEIHFKTGQQLPQEVLSLLCPELYAAYEDRLSYLLYERRSDDIKSQSNVH